MMWTTNGVWHVDDRRVRRARQRAATRWRVDDEWCSGQMTCVRDDGDEDQ